MTVSHRDGNVGRKDAFICMMRGRNCRLLAFSQWSRKQGHLLRIRFCLRKEIKLEESLTVNGKRTRESIVRLSKLAELTDIHGRKT